MSGDVIKLESADISLKEGSYLLIKLKPIERVIGLEDVQQQYQVIFRLTHARKLPVLLDARDALPRLSNEAMNFIAKDPGIAPYRKAEAIVVNNLATRLMAQVYYLFHKPFNPLRIFTSEAAALKWLKKYY